MAKLKEIIGEELFNKLSDEKKKEFENQDLRDVSEGKFVSKERFDQVNQQAKDYKKQVSERDKQITDLKDEFKDAKGLKEKVEQLEADNKKQKEDYEAQIKDINFNTALKSALAPYKCKDTDYLMSKINKDLIKLNEDGSIIGLKEQVEPFKKDHEYLFEIEPKGTGSFFTGGGETGGKEPTNTNFATELGKAKAKAQEEIADINSFAAN